MHAWSYTIVIFDLRYKTIDLFDLWIVKDLLFQITLKKEAIRSRSILYEQFFLKDVLKRKEQYFKQRSFWILRTKVKQGPCDSNICKNSHVLIFRVYQASPKQRPSSDRFPQQTSFSSAHFGYGLQLTLLSLAVACCLGLT